MKKRGNERDGQGGWRKGEERGETFRTDAMACTPKSPKGFPIITTF